MLEAQTLDERHPYFGLSVYLRNYGWFGIRSVLDTLNTDDVDFTVLMTERPGTRYDDLAASAGLVVWDTACGLTVHSPNGGGVS